MSFKKRVLACKGCCPLCYEVDFSIYQTMRTADTLFVRSASGEVVEIPSDLICLPCIYRGYRG